MLTKLVIKRTAYLLLLKTLTELLRPVVLLLEWKETIQALHLRDNPQQTNQQAEVEK